MQNTEIEDRKYRIRGEVMQAAHLIG